MPFVRFSRDKRGYEYVYLMDVPTRQSKGGQPRVLYWFRTPPGLKVGREAFDKAAQQALEARYPDLTFDWKQIRETPKPAPDAGAPWRERRRLERAAKRARAVDEARDPEDAGGEDAELQQDPVADGQHPADDREALPLPADEATAGETGPASETAIGADTLSADTSQAPGDASQGQNARGRQRRRRRRGGRGRRRDDGRLPPEEQNAVLPDDSTQSTSRGNDAGHDSQRNEDDEMDDEKLETNG